MKAIASLLLIIALGVGLLSCSGGGGGGGSSTQSFAVSTTAANFGVLGNAYTSTLATTGGTAPFTWTLFVGVLPPGLALNSGTGVVSGNPNAVGNFTATFTVTDSTGKTGTGSVLFAIHPRTDRVSVDTNGTAGNGASTEPAISGATGRFVAFTSSATLTPTPGGSGAQIFVHDRQTGQPSLISTNDVGNAGNGASSHPTISATGRYVAFTSVAPNLAPIPGAIDSQIFLRDTLSSTTILVSQDAVGNAGNGASSQPTISADGRYVAFTSSATTLAPTPNGSGTQIFLRDTQGNTTILVSRDASGDAGDGASSQPTISADGRYVAFTSSATTLAPTPNGSGTQIFLRDTQGNTTILVSQDAVGDAGNGASSQPTISADGRYVAVTSVAALAPTPGGSGTQIFRRDTQANATILVSQDAVGNAGNGVSSAASINSNGGLVAFSSAADFALGATGPVDIYIRALP